MVYGLRDQRSKNERDQGSAERDQGSKGYFAARLRDHSFDPGLRDNILGGNWAQGSKLRIFNY